MWPPSCRVRLLQGREVFVLSVEPPRREAPCRLRDYSPGDRSAASRIRSFSPSVRGRMSSRWFSTARFSEAVVEPYSFDGERSHFVGAGVSRHGVSQDDPSMDRSGESGGVEHPPLDRVAAHRAPQSQTLPVPHLRCSTGAVRRRRSRAAGSSDRSNGLTASRATPSSAMASPSTFGTGLAVTAVGGRPRAADADSSQQPRTL